MKQKQQNAGFQWLILDTWEGDIREDHSLRDSISKITREKCTGCVAQEVEHLPCKLEAPDANCSYTPNNPPPPKKKKQNADDGG
jgi:hypothetical protein